MTVLRPLGPTLNICAWRAGSAWTFVPCLGWSPTMTDGEGSIKLWLPWLPNPFWWLGFRSCDFCFASLLSIAFPACMLRWGKLPCWRGTHGKELRTASGQQPAYNRGPQSKNPFGTMCCQHTLSECGAIAFSGWPLRWDYRPWTNTLITTLWWTMKQRTQLSCTWFPDSWKLWDNECILFFWCQVLG